MYKLSVTQDIDLSLTDSQHDIMFITLLQKLHRDTVKDLLRYRSECVLLEDLKATQKRKKAAERLLKYYMLPRDYEAFLENENYTFNPDLYTEI